MLANKIKEKMVFVLAAVALFSEFGAAAAADSQQGPAALSAGPTCWTLDGALEHLKYYPRDAYVQYVALQLARREGRLPEISQQLSISGGAANRFAVRQDQIDLCSIFSGSLAVQESLQLDAMRGDLPGQEQQVLPGRGRVGPRPLGSQTATDQAADLPQADIAVSELSGPTIKSHPWEKMLAGRSPEISRLARSVPADFYFAEFRSLNKLIEASELSDLWGASALSQSVQDARTQQTSQRLRRQLAVEVEPMLRPFYDAAVREVAITGSDPFVREGSDVTLLFHVRQPALFRAKMEQFLANAASSRPDATRTSGKYLGVDFEHVATPDREVYVYSAYPAPDLHVRSNSRAAFERVLSAILGRSVDGRPVTRLGDSDEFSYIRTLMPAGAAEEDGFIYLSDPFIRRLVGPTLRLSEQRRMMCYNHLKMIGHAALMYRTERGANADSLDALAEAECTPGEFGKGKLICPDGGEYSLADDGLTGVCSHHGYASYLTPCSEIEAEHVTAAEADAYRRFLQEYNTYWRQYFDPIAIRLQTTPDRYRVETIVLPLIDNSLYTRLATSLGGSPEPLDALPVPQRTIFSVAVRLNKNELLRQMGMEELIEEREPEVISQDLVATRKAVESLKQLIVAMHGYAGSSQGYSLPVDSVDKEGRRLLSWRVHVLPHLGQQALYEQFHLDEPWDSEHNRTLVERIPAVYRPENEALAKTGRTKFMEPSGKGALFPGDGQAVAFRDIRDGSSMTIALVEVDDEHAVVWTKPEDMEVDPEQPLHGLAIRTPGAFLTAFADGRVQFLRSSVDSATLAALFTRSGREVIDMRNLPTAPLPFTPRRERFPLLSKADVRELKLGELLTKGIGNQVGFHVYDAEPAFDLSLSQFLGMTVGSMRGGIGVRNEMIWIAMLVGSLNSPVYVSIPVQDEQIVDEFLIRLDKVLAELARRPAGGFFLRLDQDYYQLQPDLETPVRGYTFRVGPLKWRFFWSRIGNAIYVASNSDILTDLRALDAKQQSASTDAGPVAHAMVRIRPQHWNHVLETYRLGWEENNREACLNNVGPLSSLVRAVSAGRTMDSEPITGAELSQFTERLCDAHYFCSDGGKYVVSPDGTFVTCTVHGSAQSPRQQAAPSERSELGRLMQSIADVNVSLLFLDDGLHAILTIERAPNSE